MEENNNVEEVTVEENTAPEAECAGACEENGTKKEKKTSKKESKEVKELTAKVEELTNSLAEQNDKYLRMAAEYDNFRRRSREEKDATYENAMADTVAEILPIIDNLERAAQCDAEGSVKEGLIMISKSVESVLAKLGVEPVGAVGDKFDPNLHNAVMHDEDDTLGENEIVEVYQKGYRKGNKIIRFAMVKTVN